MIKIPIKARSMTYFGVHGYFIGPFNRVWWV
jgi:hypothetical protein